MIGGWWCRKVQTEKIEGMQMGMQIRIAVALARPGAADGRWRVM